MDITEQFIAQQFENTRLFGPVIKTGDRAPRLLPSRLLFKQIVAIQAIDGFFAQRQVNDEMRQQKDSPND